MEYKDYYWLNNHSRLFMERGYLKEGVSPETRVTEIAIAAQKILGIPGFAVKFENYMKKGYYSLATPVWCNFGNTRGLPVSCFGSYISDTMEDILTKVAEVGTMCKHGGGTSGYFGALRSRGAPLKTSGGESSGSVHFMEFFDKTAEIISQGSARRGSFAAYLPIEHEDILEFLQIREEGHPIQNMNFGVCITNKWMEEMIAGDKAKRALWSKVIEKRFESGYPYIEFIDHANDQAPQVYKDKGLTIKASNLCTEIQLASDVDNSFVCVLSSINLLHWDEIVNTDAIETMIYFLDAVNEEFILKTYNVKYMECARRFAKSQRALGLGALGWHSLLQSKMIPFESMEAKILNSTIWKTIRERADVATQELATLLGEPELLVGYGRRNVTTLAIAPTTSSSFILGQVSPSIEPENSNYYVKKLAKGSFTYKNPYLKKLLKQKDQNNEEVWRSILINAGSVQHLDFLTENEKDVFKTFGETSHKEIIIQAASRQKRIDQGQSLNFQIQSTTKPKDVNKLMILAWENKIKSLYYQRNVSPTQELARDITSCKSCEA